MSASLHEPPCDEWAAMLHGLLDGELDAVHIVRCEEHMASCEACAAELARLRALRRLLSEDDVRWHAPETLRAKIVADVTQHSGALAREADVSLGGWDRFMAILRQWGLIPSLAVLAASLFIAIAPLNRGGQLADDLVAGHVRSLLADHLTDVSSSNRHVVKPWFVGKLEFAPPVIDLGKQGFPLIGGRADYIDGRVVAALVYRRHGHVINLFIWPANAAGGRNLMREGYNLMNWKQGGLTFWAVTDLETDELRQFQQALAAATRR